MHQAFLDAGGQEVIDPNMTGSVPELSSLISLCVNSFADRHETGGREDGCYDHWAKHAALTLRTTLTKLQQMLSSKFGLRWEESGCALHVRGTYTSNPVHPYNSQDAIHGMSSLDDMIVHLLQLISNGDFSNDFGFDLISSNSSGIIFSAPDSKFEHQSVFRRLLPWYKHAGIPHRVTAGPRKRNADEVAAESRQPESIDRRRPLLECLDMWLVRVECLLPRRVKILQWGNLCEPLVQPDPH